MDRIPKYTCPKCGKHTDLYSGLIEASKDYVYYCGRCNKCNTLWKECYTLDYSNTEVSLEDTTHNDMNQLLGAIVKEAKLLEEEVLELPISRFVNGKVGAARPYSKKELDRVKDLRDKMYEIRMKLTGGTNGI